MYFVFNNKVGIIMFLILKINGQADNNVFVNGPVVIKVYYSTHLYGFGVIFDAIC